MKYNDLRLTSIDLIDGEFELDGTGIDYLFKRESAKQVNVIHQMSGKSDTPELMSLSKAFALYEELIEGGSEGMYPYRVRSGDPEKFFAGMGE